MKEISILLALFVLNSYASTLKVMSYNAHNLFDVNHDEGKNDWEYLPKNYPGKYEACSKIENQKYKQSCLDSDWTEEKLDMKLNQLVKVISTVERPAFLALVEVENEKVVRKLADKLGYKNIAITHGPDERGIEVSLLFNESELIKHVDTKELVVSGHKYFENKPTRNILEVEFQVAGEPLTIFVNHWPSQSNPSSVRVKAAKTVKRAITKKSIFSKKHKFIVLGDFNVVQEDQPNAINTVLLNFKDNRDLPKTKLKDIFTITELLDAHSVLMNNKKVDYRLKASFPKGTYFYKTNMSWNILDKILYSDNLVFREDKLQVDPLSYRIISPLFAQSVFAYTNKDDFNFGSIIKGIPFASNHNALNALTAGYSDHFPVTLDLVIK